MNFRTNIRNFSYLGVLPSQQQKKSQLQNSILPDLCVLSMKEDDEQNFPSYKFSLK